MEGGTAVAANAAGALGVANAGTVGAGTAGGRRGTPHVALRTGHQEQPATAVACSGSVQKLERRHVAVAAGEDAVGSAKTAGPAAGLVALCAASPAQRLDPASKPRRSMARWTRPPYCNMRCRLLLLQSLLSAVMELTHHWKEVA